MITNSNDAREYFDKCGLNYSLIKEEHFCMLQDFLVRELLKRESQLKMKMSRLLKRHKPVYGENGFKHAFIQVDGPYFKRREAISFNGEGFIGFSGWASSSNQQPMINAFIKWCDWFVKEKDVDAKGDVQK